MSTVSSIRSCASLLALLAALAACSEKDETAPPAPSADPVVSPTSLAKQTITGSAEYGATVTITGGTQTVSVIADPFTALFRAEVELNTNIPSGAASVTNTLSLVATDAAGNASAATVVDILYEPPHPEAIVLELSADVITADEGEITAVVHATNDELMDLSGFEITFTLSGVPGVSAPDDVMTAISNSSGVARAVFTGLHVATDSATITASAFSLRDERSFEIMPGRAAAFSALALEGAAADGAIAAGEDVAYTYETEDQYGNAASGQVMVSVNDPGAVVLDDGLSGSGLVLGLTRSGSYVIGARIAGSGVTQTLNIDVHEAAGARYVDLALTLSRMAVNDTVMALTVVRDAFGNAISTPAPSFSIEAQNPATTNFHTQSGNELTITKAGVYAITATFDDGVNDAASASEYILVENIPDLEAPIVTVSRVNGFPVCPVSGLLTDDATLADCATRSEPAFVFRRGTPVIVTLRVRDDRSLSEVAYKAFGGGISVDDFTLIGDGQYAAGSDLDIAFNFTVQNGWAGDVALVGQAKDASGNIANSAPAHIRVRLDIQAGDRAVSILASGAYMSNSRDAAVAPDGSVFVANNDSAIPLIYQVGGTAQSVAPFVDLYPLRPQFLAFDAGGNLYTVIDRDLATGNGLDQVMITSPQGVTSLYLPDQGNGFDPEGVEALAGGTPARGRWDVTGTLPANSCLSVQTGASTHFTLQVNDTGSGACSGTCPGALAGQTVDDCVLTSLASASATRGDVVAKLNANSATTGLSAFASPTCNTLPGAGSGAACVFLVAAESGASPAPLASLPIDLRSTSGNWTPRDVDRGEDADVLFVVDNNNDTVIEVQVAPSAGTGVVGSYDFAAGGWSNGNLRDVAPVLRRAQGDASSLAPRLFVFVTDDNGGDGAQILGYDSGRNAAWILADGTSAFPHVSGGASSDSLNSPWGIVYVPGNASGGDCLLVANRERTGNFALRGEILAYTDLDDAGGATLEGGLPMVTGFDRVRGLALDTTDPDPANWSLIVTDDNAKTVARIGRSAAANDCF